MSEAYHLGGWGMYPTTIMGVLLLVAATMYARRPERRYVPIVVSLSILTFLSGCLGFLTGVITTIKHATDGSFPEPTPILTLTGIGESLHNVGLALALLIMATIAMTVGALRAARDPKAAQA